MIAGGMDMYFAKLDSSSMNLDWLVGAHSTSFDVTGGVVWADSKLLFTGFFQGTGTFGSTSFTSYGSYDPSITDVLTVTLTLHVGSYDIVIGALSESGTIEWAVRAGGTGSDNAKGITYGGGVGYCVGFFTGSLKTILCSRELLSPQ